MVSTASRVKTYEDFLKTPNDGRRYELFDGEIFVSPSASQRHQWASQLLNRRLDRFVESHDLGRVYTAPLDVHLDRNVILEPDLLFVRHDAPAANFTTTWIYGAPTLVVEILSNSTATRDLHRKRELYEQYGVEEYWIVDLALKTITPLQLVDGRYRAIPQTNNRFVSRAIPGFEINIAEIFEAI
jgi:Uma2 family endonuclease